jgi:hypothetical protein
MMISLLKKPSAVETDRVTIPIWFATEVRRQTEGSSDAPKFNKHLRNVMEPFVSQAGSIGSRPE